MSHQRKIKDRNKPKGLTTAYAYFVRHHRDELKKDDPHRRIIFTEFSKECGQLWKNMTAEERKPFLDLSNEDQKRRVHEMKYYVPSEHKQKGIKKEVYDPNGPRPNRPAFYWFSHDFTPIIKSENPIFRDMPMLAEELERRWDSMEERQKAIYVAQGERDRKRFEREMVNYKKSSNNPPKEAAIRSIWSDSSDDE